MDMNNKNSLELEAIYEEDAYYADLTRQILLLTADDDGDGNGDFLESKHSDSLITSKTGHSSNLITCSSSSALEPASFFSSWQTQEVDSVPTWLLDLWRKSNGTGVFIPQIVKSRRRYKPAARQKKKKRTASGETSLKAHMTST
ncbi:hypothetical protein K2173_017151 [Erythroxylum novogranatense]|uniref:Uncharacterized protein n=1 Tax=Erythroxylum novogranatense TaxID=1862640 RepID=A0AAV8U9R7_9ROSI|nr:hypothetical protein K2173_017151 [Erythroxylum novogranatense]